MEPGVERLEGKVEASHRWHAQAHRVDLDPAGGEVGQRREGWHAVVAVPRVTVATGLKLSLLAIAGRCWSCAILPSPMTATR